MSVTETDCKLHPAGSNKEWNWHPELPIENSPLFAWPPNFRKIAKWIAGSWLTLTEKLIFAVIAVLVWIYLQPPLEETRQLAFGWVAEIYIRNMVLMFLVAGGLHLYFYTYSQQGKRLKFDGREVPKRGRSYTLNSQLWDNMFWTCVSGVTQWTAYEALLIWAMSNGYAPVLTWGGNPAGFIAWFIAIPIWTSLHFYFVHRLLHWPPLYKVAHALHHRNTDVGPWSGLSMHPIEHVIYLSSVLVHFVIASHPIHVMFHMYWNTLGAATTHTGYEGVLLKDKNRLTLGAFHHQLHHRYFECNYGNAEMPWDRWFGSFHDGTPEATERVRERRRRMHGVGSS